MHVGTGLIFQATDKSRTDLEVYQNELRLGVLAERLGFQSIWGVEHHFTDYTMCPDVLQYLTYFAAKTETVQLGSMVVVLPWHDPLRVAEQVSMLDNMSNGRLILGLGRGLGRVEFEGFGVDMNESREIFIESAQMLLGGLETGVCEFDGTHVKQVRREIRPRPFKSFRDRTYAAAVSPESVEIMARLGVGILIIPQKPWDVVAAELATYRDVFQRVNGRAAPAPIVGAWTFCDEDEGRAREMAVRYIGGYWNTVVQHYELRGDHLKHTKGYETYGRLQDVVNVEGGADAATQFFLDIQVWGTPEQCFDKIMRIRSVTGLEWYNGVFSYAGMPWADVERSMRLFAREVMPRLKAVGAPESLQAKSA
ncbi:MAG TPA: LLM class flavin-dependent oxidoreductase [Candidatus Eisenbacteria bacterium]|nr:LLM class flavin-dependent oxidoreductase [Candidatus Eisenbacteria bacterium]